MAERARRGLAAALRTPVGGQDEMVFDGASFALEADGSLAARAPMFEEALAVLEVSATGLWGEVQALPAFEAQAWGALVIGVRDYGQERLPGAIIGLSGGIDSALVLAIAVDALGPTRCAR